MDKVRYIVLTDIVHGMEVDDIQSMVRLLLYSNEIDIEGLIACSSCFVKKGNWKKNEGIIHKLIDAYGAVRSNLLYHAKGYPTAEELHRITYCGIPCFGKAPGDGFAEERFDNNEGVQCILRAADKEDSRPLWIGIWGGTNTLAQAVWVAQKTKSKEEFERFLSRLRIYSISDQDFSGQWLRQQFGDRLFYIVSPSFGDSSGSHDYYRATWPGISADRFEHGSEDGRKKGGFSGADKELVGNKWIRKHIRSCGSYGKCYPQTRFIMEGDTPTFLGLIPNGLNEPEHPDYGGWGGRYERYLPAREQFGIEEAYSIWTNTSDTVVGLDGKVHTSPQATIWRWREAFQHDFEARMRWTMTSDFTKVNHPPIIQTEMKEITVRAGEEVVLHATVTDSNETGCNLKWFLYPEAGTKGVDASCFQLKGTDSETLCFRAPVLSVEKASIHFILQATNQGEPPLTRYCRFIVTIMQ